MRPFSQFSIPVGVISVAILSAYDYPIENGQKKLIDFYQSAIRIKSLPKGCVSSSTKNNKAR